MPEIVATSPFPNRKAFEAYAQQYSLLLPERQSAARAGDISGRRTGSSIEYQDRKDYVPGDDLRHIDWRAYARNDRLTIKLYREEISPRVDIIVDASLSMSVTEEKRQRRLELAYLFALLGRKLQGQTRLYHLGKNLQPFHDPLHLLAVKDGRQDTPLPLLQASPLIRQGGIKIFISDFLFPFAPHDLIGLFSGADRILFIQVLSAFEDTPAPGGSIRLEDAENGQYMDVQLNPATVSGYLARLNQLREDMERLLRVRGGAFACIRDDHDPAQMMTRLLEGAAVGV
ncbi:TPA: hypothetical protein DDW35_04575 [Candidatus Sumerlaeota bacterium]|nr:hypothetical protein [Candidatus Sumerlaeota bacterium]